MERASNNNRSNQLQDRIFEGLYGEQTKLNQIEIQKYKSNPVEGYLAYVNDFYKKDIQ